MQTSTVTLVTIIAEGLLRERLVADLARLGARGYTYGEVHGHGASGIPAQFWDGAQIRIETLVGAAIAERILAHLQEAYFPAYSVVAYAAEVRVLRPEKYV